jgi:hypothetical protein
LPEQSENVYENKESSSREVKELRSWEAEVRGWGLTPTVCHSRLSTLDLNLPEQSENVFENKGPL